MLPESSFPGFFWHADPKIISKCVEWASKQTAKPADTPGTKATGVGMRNCLHPLPVDRSRDIASHGGLL